MKIEAVSKCRIHIFDIRSKIDSIYIELLSYILTGITCKMSNGPEIVHILYKWPDNRIVITYTKDQNIYRAPPIAIHNKSKGDIYSEIDQALSKMSI